MALFYLVRHGEPDYDAVARLGFYGFGLNFAPLSEAGIRQAKQTAADPRLLEAELIVSSPYTRALQTAAILADALHKEIVVEPELHEWINDKTNTLSSDEEAARLFREFKENKGVYPDGEEKCWETVASLQARVRRVADKYATYNKVIFVAHGMVCKVLARAERMSYAEIIPCQYESGQEVPFF
ncbi:MAG: histidine phosphatase family protein [Clostridia bacterium]|nr:histidine phosphatase family protein [Clostridia bacterium]